MKQRARRYFTQTEMSEVWDRWEQGESLNAIARSLDRYHSAVQGALARTGGIRPAPRRRSRLALTPAEREEISRGLVAGHSIRAIALQLGRAPSTVSREVQRNGGRRCYRANKADEAAWQRSHRPRHHTQKTSNHGRITDAVSISERPPEAEDRTVPGHWEGDLLCGSNNSQIATLVERHTRYVMLVRVPSKDTKTVINALIKQAHKLPRELYKSLTWDRGSEMADHTQFSLATDIDVFFCDPQHP